MKIEYFKIENYRNISFAECNDVPNLMVICGGNGCGKSTILNALMAAKENAAPYGGFQMDPRCVAADATRARVSLRICFSDHERSWYKEKYNADCPEKDEIVLEIQQGGRATVPKRSQVTRNLLSWYSKEYRNSPGFFDYIDAHRIVPKKQLSTWNSASLSDNQSKQKLGAVGTQKFDFIKEYLASLVLKDAQEILAAKRKNEDSNPDSLKDIRDFFNSYFKPMMFKDVQIDCSPFKFIIQTPKGEIDIDDLSSGEKEILSTYIHFHQMNPDNAVILFDEIDAHLHPELERRYLELFQKMSENNQILLTTHSPEIMVAAGSESLFTMSKVQKSTGDNQLSRVTENEELHSALTGIMGTNGLVSINRKVVFIEGKESSSDRYIFESFFPPSMYNITFIPVGDSLTNISTSERVNKLLSSAGTFQEFYSIIDGDIDRITTPEENSRLFKLPVYHIENYLLDSEHIFRITHDLLRDKCPVTDIEDVENLLISLLTEDGHLLPYTKALFDSSVAIKAKQAWDSVYKKESDALADLKFPIFDEIRDQAIEILNRSKTNGDWKEKCKGRDLLKIYCSRFNFNYEHFRNLLISNLGEAPESLNAIIDKIIIEK